MKLIPIPAGKILLPVCLLAQTTLAQEPPGDNPPLEEELPIVLEEVVVTAQRKEESIQEAPISIVAFTSENLETLSINSLVDFNAQVPNFALTPFPTSSTTVRLYMRGVGPNDVQLTQDPSVALYLNQVYIARSTGLALDVADLERVEVLRGPQGTLYGRNATGGAVNLVTAAPLPGEWGFKQQFTVGNFDRRMSKTSVNVPLGNKAALKAAYLYNTKDGFIDNTGPGEDFGDRTDQGGRIDLLWQATDTFSVSYAYDKSLLRFVNTPPQSETSSLLGPAETLTEISAAAASRIDHQEGRLDSFATASVMQEAETDIEGHALTLEWEALDSLLIKYIGAYRKVSEKNFTDLVASRKSGVPAYILANAGDRVATISDDPLNGGVTATYNLFEPAFSELDQSQWSHEVNFFGDVNDALNYTAGLYYFRETGSETSPLSQQIILDEAIGTLDLLVMNESDVSIENSAWSVFGELYYRPAFLDRRLEFTFGYRHSQDEREADRIQNQNSYIRAGGGAYANAQPGIDIQVAGSPSKSFSNNSFNFITKYDINDFSNTYFKIAQGYKTGGFNTRAPTTELFLNGFDPETLVSYEIGYKGDLLDRRLRLNAAAFYVDYDDIQMNLRIPDDPTLTDVINAGKANIMGVELDITALLTRNLTAYFNWGHLYTRFNEVLETDQDGNVVDNADDYVFPNAPRNSVTAGLDYLFPFVQTGDLLFNLNYRFRTGTPSSGDKDQVFNPENGVKGAYIDTYRLFDARLAWNNIPLGASAKGGNLSLALWGKNLFDEEYELDVFILPHTFRGVVWGEPRSYGFDLIYRY